MRRIDHKKLYWRLFTYIDKAVNSGRFEAYWRKYGKGINDATCRRYLENIVKYKPDFNGWGYGKIPLSRKIEFDSIEQMEMFLTLNGH